MKKTYFDLTKEEKKKVNDLIKSIKRDLKNNKAVTSKHYKDNLKKSDRKGIDVLDVTLNGFVYEVNFRNSKNFAVSIIKNFVRVVYAENKTLITAYRDRHLRED